jgi:hypothetical protein
MKFIDSNFYTLLITISDANIEHYFENNNINMNYSCQGFKRFTKYFLHIETPTNYLVTITQNNVENYSINFISDNIHIQYNNILIIIIPYKNDNAECREKLRQMLTQEILNEFHKN